MVEYFYCPILKTRQSEVDAYDMLDSSVKDEILPIIEMTGALGYTYPKNYKIEELRHTHRNGDIYKKINKILDLVQDRRFILDITDDESLMYDGLKEDGGLLDPSNGYEKWISFLNKDDKFKKLVIPTIQFNTAYKEDLIRQIQSLNNTFDYLAIKLPAFISSVDTYSSDIIFNASIQRIVSWISQFVKTQKLILIIDFGYIKDYALYEEMVNNGMKQFKELDIVKAIIPVSSSFPNFVVSVSKPIKSFENVISSNVKNSIKTLGVPIIHGDYASIHPTKYEMGGGGWIPRIDYIVRDENGRPVYFDYARGSKKNTSSEYPILARLVIDSYNYKQISEIETEGDIRIKNRANNGQEGKAPAYWIAVRSNLYLTVQYLYVKKERFGVLSL